jgi:hypothetical protein
LPTVARYAVRTNDIFQGLRTRRYTPEEASATGSPRGSRFLPVEISEAGHGTTGHDRGAHRRLPLSNPALFRFGAVGVLSDYYPIEIAAVLALLLT